MTTVLNIGTYDVLHPGHVGLFRACRKVAGRDGRVVVGINSEDFVERTKRRRPVMDQALRMAVVAAIRYVDEVFPFGGDHPAAFEAVKPDFYVSGMDWAARDIYAQWGLAPQWVRDHGVTVVYVDHEHAELHSSDLRNRTEVAR